MTGAGGRAARFDSLYRRTADPWNLATSDYEREKYDATLEAAGTGPFLSTLEVGCSIGILSGRLAALSGRFLGIDVSEVALTAARARNADIPQARFEVADAPREWPHAGPGVGYDLIVFSEILYFLEPDEIEEMARLAARDLVAGGLCLLVNWTGPCDLTLDGNEAAELFLRNSAPALRATMRLERPGYRIDRLHRDRDTIP